MSFDGRMIGLKGEVVYYPRFFFRMILSAQRGLNRKAKEANREPIKIIERDHASGLWRVLEPIREQLGPFIDLPDFRHKPLRASDPAFHSGRSKDSGRKGMRDLLELGIKGDHDVER